MSARNLLPLCLLAGCAAPNPQGAELGPALGVQASAIGADGGLALTAPTSGAVEEAGADFTLAVAMDIARLNSLQVLRAADAQLAANADLRLAKSDAFYPELSFGARTGRLSGIAQNTDGSFISDVDKQNANLGVGLRLSLDPASATHGIDAAEEGARAATWDWVSAGLAAETAAALLYYDLLEAQARVEIAAAALDSANAFHALSEARFQAGATLESNVLRAFAHLAEVRQQHLESIADLGITSTRLAELLGLDPMRPLKPADTLEPRALIADVAGVNLASHPSMEAAQARLAAAKSRVKEQRAGRLLPELLLDAGYNDFGREFGELDSQESFTATLSWDLSPALFAMADRAHAELMRAEHDAEAAHRRVSAELVRSQIAALSAADLVEMTSTRVDSARSAVALERARHESGDALLIELLDAEVSLRRAETANVAAICSHNRAQHLLRQALGG